MANWFRSTTIVAAEDLSGSQYKAIALDDGKVAVNGQEAIGIICNKPISGQNVTVGYVGEMFYQAGAAVSKGDALTVTTGGWFKLADSNDFVVGQAKADVTSGSQGTGLFSFPAGIQSTSMITYDVTAADAIPAGRGYALGDNKLANNQGEVAGIAQTTIASGSTGQIAVQGIMAATLSDSYGPDMDLMCVTSGYFDTPTSGYVANARVMVGASSGTNATVLFWGGGGLAVSA
jgi:hypothetical protein